MSEITRRQYLALAASVGASLAWCRRVSAASRVGWRERRDLFPKGVASGDLAPDSLVLWTRYASATGTALKLTVEVSEDADFTRVVASAPATAEAASDWTVRVLVGPLAPGRVYWYRFSTYDGAGSRIGRTSGPRATSRTPRGPQQASYFHELLRPSPISFRDVMEETIRPEGPRRTPARRSTSRNSSRGSAAATQFDRLLLAAPSCQTLRRGCRNERNSELRSEPAQHCTPVWSKNPLKPAIFA